MLIISKFHDYYDSAIAYGVDKECVYERKTETVKDSKWKYRDYTDFENKDFNFRLTTHTIGFCGNVYRCVRVEQQNKYSISDKKIHGFYRAEDIISFMEENDIGLREKGFSRWSSTFRSTANINAYFNAEKKQHLYDMFREYNTPIYVINRNNTVINPCLKDFKFGKVRDAVTAFQDIHQYIAGVLGSKEKDTVDISDKTRIQQHGFDKWSFRKLPSKKK